MKPATWIVASLSSVTKVLTIIICVLVIWYNFRWFVLQKTIEGSWWLHMILNVLFGIGSRMIDICAVLWIGYKWNEKDKWKKGSPRPHLPVHLLSKSGIPSGGKLVKTFLQQIIICTTGNMLSPTLLSHLSQFSRGGGAHAFLVWMDSCCVVWEWAQF